MLVQLGIRQPTDDVGFVTSMVSRLIEALYIPVLDDREFITDPARIRGIDAEPINWGDLSCCEVIKDRDSDVFIATLDEAAPDGCPKLCEYIVSHMESWGWIVRVQTEW